MLLVNRLSHLTKKLPIYIPKHTVYLRLTAESRVHTRFNPCGMCGGQSGTGADFSPTTSVFTCQYHSTVALHTHIIWGMNNMSVSGSSLETLTPSRLINQSIKTRL
jgi:hypothetical protein